MRCPGLAEDDGPKKETHVLTFFGGFPFERLIGSPLRGRGSQRCRRQWSPCGAGFPDRASHHLHHVGRWGGAAIRFPFLQSRRRRRRRRPVRELVQWPIAVGREVGARGFRCRCSAADGLGSVTAALAVGAAFRACLCLDGAGLFRYRPGNGPQYYY